MKRPFGITVLAVMVGLAASIAVIHTLQLLHLFPIAIGPTRFFTFNFWGAVLWGISAAVWLWVFRMLWTMNPFGWLTCVALAAANLGLIVINLIGQATWQSLLPSAIVAGLVLIYCLLPSTREAFEGST
jgi:hypothetical protein